MSGHLALASSGAVPSTPHSGQVSLNVLPPKESLPAEAVQVSDMHVTAVATTRQAF